jgi:NDP-sugar pyrophosphorylase family protein
MAGLGQRFYDEGFETFKPFILIDNKTIIEYVLDSFGSNATFVIITRTEIFLEYEPIINQLKKKYPLKISLVDFRTIGSAATVLTEIALAENYFEFIVADCDSFFAIDVISKFIKDVKQSKCDAAILSFRSESKDFSYLEVVGNVVTKVAEKNVISEHASTGVYYFSDSRKYLSSAIDYLVTPNNSQSEFYISTLINVMIKKTFQIKFYELNNDEYFCVGTPKQLRNFLEKEKK